MTFQLAPCTPDDMHRAFVIVSEAFGNEHPYIDYVFPRHDTDAGRRLGGERFLAIMRGDPNTIYLKVTEVETGTIIAVAKWNIYDGVIPPEAKVDGNYWDSDMDKQLAQEIFAGYLKPRRQAIQDSGGHLVSLDMMTVHPDYQRQGAGRMLLKWGVSIADEMGVETVVEATKQGKGLYTKEGFEVRLNRYTAELSKQFSGKPTQTFTWMVRPAKDLKT